MGLFVRASEIGAYYSRAIHDAWDALQQPTEHAPPAVGGQPAKPSTPPTRVLNKPHSGSSDHPDLVNLAVSTMQTASALLPTKNLAASGISAVASLVSSTMAEGVNPTAAAMFGKSKEFARTIYSSAGTAVYRNADIARNLAARHRGYLASRMPSAAASALRPAKNLAASGISAVASLVSSTVAEGVNPTAAAMFGKSKEFAGTIYSSAGTAVYRNADIARSLAARHRGYLNRFMRPRL